MSLRSASVWLRSCDGGKGIQCLMESEKNRRPKQGKSGCRSVRNLSQGISALRLSCNLRSDIRNF